jgi:hypothetical protein
LKSAAISQAKKKRLDKVKRIVEHVGLHVKRVYEEAYREYVVIITDEGTQGEEEKLYKLGLTVTSIHLSKTNKYRDKKEGKRTDILNSI